MGTAKEATKYHNRIHHESKNDMKHFLLYSDGSDIKGRVGASLWCPKLKCQIRADLGPTSKATVYTAELLGILYSIITVVTTRNVESATLFVDNQAAIQSVHNLGGQSGQLILRQIIHFISTLQKRGVSVEICWIPAHTRIPGNEKADIIAKQATGWRAKGQTEQRAP